MSRWRNVFVTVVVAIPDLMQRSCYETVNWSGGRFRGTANHGCPEIKKETKEKINYIAHNILFNSSSDQLIDSSYLALDELAKLMNDNPEAHLTIEGYTDNSGKAEKNLLLSQKRALAVKNYLIKKGIIESRLTAAGLGQEHPIADNSTPAGRAINRRVELKLSQEK